MQIGKFNSTNICGNIHSHSVIKQQEVSKDFVIEARPNISFQKQNSLNQTSSNIYGKYKSINQTLFKNQGNRIGVTSSYIRPLTQNPQQGLSQTQNQSFFNALKDRHVLKCTAVLDPPDVPKPNPPPLNNNSFRKLGQSVLNVNYIPSNKQDPPGFDTGNKVDPRVMESPQYQAEMKMLYRQREVLNEIKQWEKMRYSYDWNYHSKVGISDISDSVARSKKAFCQGIEEFDEIIQRQENEKRLKENRQELQDNIIKKSFVPPDQYEFNNFFKKEEKKEEKQKKDVAAPQKISAIQDNYEIQSVPSQKYNVKNVEKIETKKEIKEDFKVTGNSEFKQNEIKQNHNFFNQAQQNNEQKDKKSVQIDNQALPVPIPGISDQHTYLVKALLQNLPIETNHLVYASVNNQDLKKLGFSSPILEIDIILKRPIENEQIYRALTQNPLNFMTRNGLKARANMLDLNSVFQDCLDHRFEIFNVFQGDPIYITDISQQIYDIMNESYDPEKAKTYIIDEIDHKLSMISNKDTDDHLEYLENMNRIAGSSANRKNYDQHETTSVKLALEAIQSALQLVFISKNPNVPPPSKVRDIYQAVSEKLSYDERFWINRLIEQSSKDINANFSITSKFHAFTQAAKNVIIKKNPIEEEIKLQKQEELKMKIEKLKMKIQ